MCDVLDTFDLCLTTALAHWHLSIAPSQIEQLRTHFQAVVKTNRAMNLTRITDPIEAAIKHYADSLALLKWVADRSIGVQTLLDIGTGAGFPAVPLAVMRPDWSVTAIDATRKKIDFLQRTTLVLGLTNLRCEHAHSQHWHPSRSFQLVVLRALTALPRALEQNARHVARGGWLVAYKTSFVDPGEQKAAKKLSAKLGLRAHQRYAYDLTLEDEKLDRVLYTYRKA